MLTGVSPFTFGGHGHERFPATEKENHNGRFDRFIGGVAVLDCCACLDCGMCKENGREKKNLGDRC
jgi:hypothetical protein